MLALKSNLRNLIINGGFDFWQRGTSTPSITSDLYRTVDRFQLYTTTNGGTPTGNIFQTTDVPAELEGIVNHSPTFSLSATSGQDVDGEVHRILHKVESVFASQLYNKKGTFSFYYKTSHFTDIRLQVVTPQAKDNFGSNDTVYARTTHAITNDGEWNRFEVTIDFSSGDARNGIWILLFPSNRTTTGATDFRMTGIMLHEGDVAQPFQRAGKNYQEEFQLCERYFEKSYTLSKFAGSTTDAASARFVRPSDDIGQRIGISLAGKFVTEKRAAPLVSFYNHRGNGAQNTFSRYNADDNLPMTNNTGSSTKGIDGYFQAGVNLSDSAWGFHFYADAEL